MTFAPFFDSEEAEQRESRMVPARDFEALKQALEDVLALSQPWPLRDALAKMVEAVEHLLKSHACDRHGHEEYAVAMQTAAALLPKLDAAQALLLKVRK